MVDIRLKVSTEDDFGEAHRSRYATLADVEFVGGYHRNHLDFWVLQSLADSDVKSKNGGIGWDYLPLLYWKWDCKEKYRDIIVFNA